MLGGGGYPNNPYANSLSPIFLLGCLKKCLMLREIFISPSHFRFLGMERTCFFFLVLELDSLERDRYHVSSSTLENYHRV